MIFEFFLEVGLGWRLDAMINCFDFRLYLEFSRCGFTRRVDPHDEEGGGERND